MTLREWSRYMAAVESGIAEDRFLRNCAAGSGVGLTSRC